MADDFWIFRINTTAWLSTRHISEFVEPWTRISEVTLVEGTTDGITWKFTTSGVYSATSTYKAQFEGMTRSSMPEVVCGKIGY
jgi:hypothetical protein